MARQIFFINRFFYPDQSATSQMLTDLAFNLAADGHNVVIISSRQLIDNANAQLPANAVINNVHVLRVWTTTFGRAGLVGRTIDYLSFYFATLFCLFGQVRQDDIVVAKTDPPLISLIAAVVTKSKGAVLINWLQDIFPEVAVALDVRGSHVLAPILTYLRNITLRLAKNNVVLGEKMAELVDKNTHGLAKTVIIANWSDGDSIKPIQAENNVLRTSWGLQQKFVVGYSGNMGRAHDFDTILQAAFLLKSQANIQFLFIGSGAQRTILQQKFSERGIDNVMFQPYQDRQQLTQSLTCPDVHLISLLPELEGVIVPSKFYGIAAAGRACLFVGSLDGEIARIIEKEECGYAVQVGDTDSLANKILALESDRSLCTQLGKKARQAYGEKYNKKISFAAWRQLIASV